MATINFSGTMYIKDISGTVSYSLDNSTWNTVTFPATLVNTDSLNTVGTVLLQSNIILSTVNSYFNIGSNKITFDGGNYTVTINNVTGYPGMFNNGDNIINGYSYNIIKNISVQTSGGSTLSQGAGWITQDYYSRGANNNFVTYCNSSGTISSLNCGGICGDATGTFNGSCIISYCYTTGIISNTSCGGISGGGTGRNNGSCTILNCYSLGDITGAQAGGICGIGTGITNGNCIVRNCYSLGNISGNQTGGIIGNNSNYCSVINCYSYGLITGVQAGGIYGNTKTVNSTVTNSYIANNSWSDSTANSNLTGTPTSQYVNNPGTTWLSISTNQPYLLSGFNNQLYNPNYALSDNIIFTTLPGIKTGIYYILNVNNSNIPIGVNINSSNGALTYSNLIPNTYLTNVIVYSTNSGKYYGYNINSFTYTYNIPIYKRECPCCWYKRKGMPVPFKCRCCVYRPINKCCKCNLCNKCYCRCDC